MGSKRSGFTLIELLVVIAIIAILAAILFPIFTAAQRKAQQSKCMNNMVQIGKAISMYADDNQGFTPFAYNQTNWSIWDKDTWRTRLEQGYLKNHGVLICPIPTYKPPSKAMAKITGHYGMNVYIVLDDPTNGTTTPGYRLLSSITEPTKTILVSENKDGDWSAEPFDNTASGDAGQFYPYHGDEKAKGGEFVFCDGHASFMPVYKTQATERGVEYFYWKRIKVPR